MNRKELFERMKNTKLPENKKADLWTSIEQNLTMTSTERGKRRNFSSVWTYISVAAGIVLVAGLILWQNNNTNDGVGVTASNVNNGLSNAPRQTKRPNNLNPSVRHSFSAKTDWVSPGTSDYSPGLSSVKSPHVPTAFEQTLSPKTGVANVMVSGNSGVGPWNPNPYSSEGVVKIVFNNYSFKINGNIYTVPSQYHHQKMLVLPLQSGVVWAAIPNRPKNSDHMTGKALAAKQLVGKTSIFYTPFTAHGGSLSAGATKIARLPHAWRGIDGPVLASAYTGWLPKKDIRMPTVKNEIVRHLQLSSPGAAVQSQSIVKGKLSGWPDLFKKDLSQPAYKKPRYVASIGSLTRTSGGFVLQVRFTDATVSGRNAMMSGANYFWSEQTKKWTPISQTYTVQTLAGWTDVGSNGVYWLQPCASKNGFNVAEMHFNPVTQTINSVWLGNWFFGRSFVDGNSWVAVLANDTPTASGTPKKWTVYTP